MLAGEHAGAGVRGRTRCAGNPPPHVALRPSPHLDGVHMLRLAHGAGQTQHNLLGGLCLQAGRRADEQRRLSTACICSDSHVWVGGARRGLGGCSHNLDVPLITCCCMLQLAGCRLAAPHELSFKQSSLPPVQQCAAQASCTAPLAALENRCDPPCCALPQLPAALPISLPIAAGRSSISHSMLTLPSRWTHPAAVGLMQHASLRLHMPCYCLPPRLLLPSLSSHAHQSCHCKLLLIHGCWLLSRQKRCGIASAANAETETRWCCKC